jgi:hypothetical protein
MPHVVTGRSQVWVGTGLGIVPVIIDQVVTCVCLSVCLYGIKVQLDDRVEFTRILFWDELAVLMVWLDEK